MLLKIVGAVEAGTGHQVPNSEKTTPGLLLMSDPRVYLRGNMDPNQDATHLLAYADECIPNLDRCVWKICESFRPHCDCIFLDLANVKSKMLTKAIPYIKLTAESLELGSVDSLEEIPELQEQAPTMSIEDIYFQDIEDTWRRYHGHTKLTNEFATQVLDDPGQCEFSTFFDFYMDPTSLWAKCQLEYGGEISAKHLDLSSAVADRMPLSINAVGEMLSYFEGRRIWFRNNRLNITCTFDPQCLPKQLTWEDFQILIRQAFETIAPKFNVEFKSAEKYHFEEIRDSSQYFLQFLCYQWVMDQHPELAAYEWLPVYSAETDNCFHLLISDFFGWSRCEAQGIM
ncbi:MAG: hypothetical protein ACPGF8_06865 [Opitutales bacterium]